MVEMTKIIEKHHVNNAHKIEHLVGSKSPQIIKICKIVTQTCKEIKQE